MLKIIRQMINNNKLFKPFFTLFIMSEQNSEITMNNRKDLLWKLWKRYGEPITAISIIIFFIFAGTMMVKDINLKREISANCGWGEEDYECVCLQESVEYIKSTPRFIFPEIEIDLGEDGTP